MSSVRLTMADLRSAGHCARGIRQFFDKHGLDVAQLVREGVPEDELAHIDDANLKQALGVARARVQKENQ